MYSIYLERLNEIMAEYALRVYGTQKRLIDAYDLQSERVFGVFVCVFLCLDEFVSEKNERQKKMEKKRKASIYLQIPNKRYRHYRTTPFQTTDVIYEFSVWFIFRAFFLNWAHQFNDLDASLLIAYVFRSKLRMFSFVCLN